MEAPRVAWPGTAQKERKREERHGGGKRGRERRREIYASRRRGGDRGHSWWQNARWSVEGPGGPRGRLKVAAGPHARYNYAHTQHTRILRTHAVHVRRCTTRACAQKRTRALQRRSRAYVNVCACVVCMCHACGQCAHVRQRRNSALLWRRYYVIAFVRRKNKASSQSDFSKIYGVGYYLDDSSVLILFREPFHYGGHASSSDATFLTHVHGTSVSCTSFRGEI